LAWKSTIISLLNSKKMNGRADASSPGIFL
jgi:hypothetical protein